MYNQMIMRKARNATFWSAITQLITKSLSPITNIILARLLLPENFGVVATVTVVISFTDVVIDTGFPKYLVQHEFHNRKEQWENTNVAFWSNLLVALVLWGLIILFQQPISFMVGNSNLSHVIAIAGIQIPINALYNIQTALYSRSFNYKDIFIIKIFSALIPFFVTIPLAYFGLKHWSIIIGSISGTVLSTAMLTIKSDWKPATYYSFKILKEMLSFCSWSIMEGLFTWLTTWVEIIMIGNVFSDYYLGLYTTSYNMVNALMSIMTSTIVPILFATLSRMQNDKFLFYATFLKYQRIIAYFMFPIGVGVFLYRDFVTNIIFGESWAITSNIIGICAFTMSIKITLVNIYSDVYKAIGKPKLSLYLQMVDLYILVPVCFFSIDYGFWTFVYARCLVRLVMIIPGLIFARIILKYKERQLIKNILIPIFCTVAMSFLAIWLKQLNSSNIWQIISIILCSIFYLFTILIFDLDILYGLFILYMKRKK